MRRRLKIQNQEQKEKEESDEEDVESKMLKEMEVIRERMEHRNRKERKRRLEQKRKAKIKLAKIMDTTGDVIDDGSELFSLKGLSTVQDLARVTDAPAPGVEDLRFVEKGSDMEEDEDDSAIDSDEEEDQRRLELLQEEYLEESYNRFMAEKGSSKSYRKRKRLGENAEVDSEDDFDEDDLQYNLPFGEDLHGEDKIEGGGLLVDLNQSQIGVPKTADAVSAQWFSQDVFKDIDLEKLEVGSKPNTAGDPKSDDDSVSLEVMEDSDNPDDMIDSLIKDSAISRPPDSNKAKVEADSDSDYESLKKGKLDHSNENADFEVVPVKEKDSGTDTEDEFRMLDVEAKAEVLALAKRFLHRKDKENIIDAAYNRYAFHDEHPTPKWFREDEKQHMRPVAPVTRAEVEEQKAALRALNSRPIKKVAEAKARKRKRLAQRLTNARKRAEGILAHEDTSMGSRMREVAKIYAKARSEDGKWKQGKKKKPTRKDSKRKGPPLDSRLRADKRMRGSGRNMKNRKHLTQQKQQDLLAKKARRAKKAASRG